jgi:hypothetical protein
MFLTVIVVASVRQNLKKFITNDDRQFPLNAIPNRVLSVSINSHRDIQYTGSVAARAGKERKIGKLSAFLLRPPSVDENLLPQRPP